MLARVAESLYWMGRYIERSEHCSRYLNVQYFSTLETPMLHNKDFTLRSILFISGANFDNDSKIEAQHVWQKVIFDNYNSNSLIQLTYNARENARSIKNIISSELWENINKWYLFNRSVDKINFISTNIFNFTSENIKLIALIKSVAFTTLLHNDVWRFFFLGIYLERALQVLRITKSKISDSAILSNNGANIPLQQYQYSILLRSLECFDIYNSYYRTTMIEKKSIFKLILTNESFERSVIHTANVIEDKLSNISVQPPNYLTIIEDFQRQIKEAFVLTDLDNEEKVLDKIEKCSFCFSHLHSNIEKIYFQ